MYVCRGECLKLKFWTLQLSSRRLLLGSCSLCGLVVNFGDTQSEQSDTSWILQLIRKHEAEPPIRRLITHSASTHKLFRQGKWEAWGPRKKSWCQNKWSRKREGGLESRRWRSWLQERSWKWGKILEIRVLCGEECQGCPGTLASDVKDWHSRAADQWELIRLSARLSWSSNDLPAGKGSQDLGNTALWGESDWVCETIR